MDLAVDVGGIDGHVAKPSADGIDVYASTKEMRSRRVADGMRADAFADQRLDRFAGAFGISLNHCVDSKASDGRIVAVQENVGIRLPVSDQRRQRCHSSRPERTEPDLCSLSVKLHNAAMPAAFDVSHSCTGRFG